MTQPKTALERIMGHPLTEAAGTLLGIHYPVAALLPALTNRFAAGRFAERIERTLAELDAGLEAQGEKIDKMTDEQCTLTVGIVQTIFETIDDEKRRMLTAAALNVADSGYVEAFHAQFLTRTLRAISAAEVSFLSKHRNVEWFSFGNPREKIENTLYVDSESIDSALARGLINLGLLVRAPSEGTSADTGGYSIAPLATQLIDLIERGDAMAR